MRQTYVTIPLTITVILILLIATLVVYLFDISGHPIWNTPKLIPLIFLIPLLLTGWLPLGFYGIYLNRIERNKTGILLLLLSILWIIGLVVLISCTIKSFINIYQEKI